MTTEELFDGFHTNFWPNGQKESEGNYKSQKKEGRWIEWHENGQKCSEGAYLKVKTGSWRWAFKTEPKYEKKEGLWTVWHSNGNKETEGSYKDGELEGKYTLWYKNGQKELECNYSFSKLYGKHTEWYENGNKKSIKYCRADYCGGKVSWHENGQPNVQGERVNNKVVGLWTWQDDSGNITRETFFDNNGNQVWLKEY